MSYFSDDREELIAKLLDTKIILEDAIKALHAISENPVLNPPETENPDLMRIKILLEDALEKYRKYDYEN